MKNLKKIMAQKKNEESAFTLVEIMVVVGIIAVIAAIAIPVYSNYRKNANDATVRAGGTNAAIELRTILPGKSLPFTLLRPAGQSSLVVRDSNRVEIGEIALSPGVLFRATSRANAPDNFVVCAWHANGKIFTSVNNAFVVTITPNGQNVQEGVRCPS